MQELKRCGFIFLILVFNGLNFIYSEENSPLDLDTIVITKSKNHLINSYAIESDTLGNFPYNSPVEALGNLPFGAQRIGLTYKKKPKRDGWFLLNPYFAYNLNKNSQVFLEVTNLLNVEYQEIEGIPQPGRWADVGLKFVW